MPSWVIAIIVVGVVLLIAILIGSSIAGANRQYNELLQKNYFELCNVVNDTFKLKVKLWKRHGTRNQATIFFRKLIKTQ